MTLEDPFFVVKDEVCKALNKTRGLYQRWAELQEEGRPNNRIALTREDLEWTNTELRNALRSIEWDLEDLDETIEKNPRKFKISSIELQSRKAFIIETKREVQFMKDKISQTKKESKQTYKEESPLRMPQVVATTGNTKYSRLVNEMDSPNGTFLSQTVAQQDMLIEEQNEQLDQLSSSVSTLRIMSRQIGMEVDEQAIMLDDFSNDMEHTHSRMETTLTKLSRVMRLTNDKRQWAAIGTLSVILVVIIVLFFFV